MKKAQKELKTLKEKDYWVFDCEKCGKHGECIVCLRASATTTSMLIMLG